MPELYLRGTGSSVESVQLTDESPTFNQNYQTLNYKDVSGRQWELYSGGAQVLARRVSFDTSVPPPRRSAPKVVEKTVVTEFCSQDINAALQQHGFISEPYPQDAQVIKDVIGKEYKSQVRALFQALHVNDMCFVGQMERELSKLRREISRLQRGKILKKETIDDALAGLRQAGYAIPSLPDAMKERSESAAGPSSS
jgi:hypothetical protein